MYTVIEFWRETSEATMQTINYAKATRDEAMSSYHYILYQAGVSSHYKHGAVCIDDEGRTVARDCYFHPVEVTEEETDA